MINANKDYLNSFYRGDIQYAVPFFQRPYVWDISNWEILWESIEEVFRDLQKEINNEHFIGTLIIKQRNANRLGENVYDLIDGQQRLTTFALLLKALADSCKGDLTRLKEKFLELIVFEDARGHKFVRIIHNRIDKPYFENIMFGEHIITNNNNNNKIEKCYSYFYDKVKNYTDNDREALLKIILNKVPVISMLISAEDDEQEIFDTINSLGVRLTTAELLKNFIFKEEDLKNLYESHWQSIYEIDEERISFWNKDKTSGRIIRTNIEVLLYCYLIIQTKKDIKLEKLYKEYKEWLKDKSIEEKKNFLISLKEYSELYFQLPEGEELNEFAYNENEKRFFHIIENLSVTTAYPLILFLYKSMEDAQELSRFLIILESYLVRRNICRLTTKNYNNLFLSILQKVISLKENDGKVELEKFRNIFYEFSDETNLFPDNNLLKESFSKSILSNQNAKEILYCIALYKKQNGFSDVKKLSSSNFSVEHVMPKKWEKNWEIVDTSEQAKSERSKLLLTLGNLTLITKRLNSKLKNDSWAIKKETLRKYSSLELTTEFLATQIWDETTIKNRSVALYNLATNMWSKESSPSKPADLNKTTTNGLSKIITINKENRPKRTKNGDSKFITEVQNQLNPYLASIAKKLLADIRQWYAGELQYAEKGRNYVESPDNFWTVTVQSHKQDLKITIYGTPENYSSAILQLKLNYRVYTSFFISTERELAEGLRLIKQAAKNKGVI